MIHRKRLGRKVWKEIETPQGYAYLSDAIEGMTDEQVMKIAGGALPYARQVVRILAKYKKGNTQNEPKET